MKRRIFALTLAALLCLGLFAGCAGGEQTPNGAANGAVAQAVQSGTLNYYFMAGDGGHYYSDESYMTKWGDSCLLVFPNGQTMLIDASLDTYYPRLKERLEELEIEKLDYIVFTHPHYDHCGGAWAGLMTDFEIGQVYHNGMKNSSWKEDAHIENICAANNIACSVLAKGDSLAIGDVTMKVLWPGEDEKNDLASYGNHSGAINCLSLVMRFDYGEHSSLFTGDLYKTYKGGTLEQEQTNGHQIPDHLGAEELITAMYTNGELDVDLLKLPHHGDPSTSNSAAFFAATSPKIAVATGFLPIEDYLSVYKSRGYSGFVLFDRKYGYVHVTATNDGKMQYESSRSDYLPGFGKVWNKELESK